MNDGRIAPQTLHPCGNASVLRPGKQPGMLRRIRQNLRGRLFRRKLSRHRFPEKSVGLLRAKPQPFELLPRPGPGNGFQNLLLPGPGEELLPVHVSQIYREIHGRAAAGIYLPHQLFRPVDGPGRHVGGVHLFQSNIRKPNLPGVPGQLRQIVVQSLQPRFISRRVLQKAVFKTVGVESKPRPQRPGGVRLRLHPLFPEPPPHRRIPVGQAAGAIGAVAGIDVFHLHSRLFRSLAGFPNPSPHVFRPVIEGVAFRIRALFHILRPHLLYQQHPVHGLYPALVGKAVVDAQI